MFSQVSVCLQGGSRSLSGGVSIRGVLCLGGRISVRGVPVQGGPCSGGSVSGGGGSVLGVSVRRISVQGGLCHGDSPYGNERAVRIPLECILVQLLFPFLNVNFTFALGYCARVHGTDSYRPRGKTYLSICTK